MNPTAQSPTSLSRRVVRYVPLLLWTGLILFASTQSFSAGNTSRIIRPLFLWLFPNISEAQLATVHFFTRKAAHFTEYAILAFFAQRAFITSARKWLGKHWFASSLVFVALIAGIDELHQSFVPARTGSPYDSGIDIAGGLTVLMVCWLYRRAEHHRSRG